MLSNVDVHILNLVNTLSQQYEIDPCSFVATVRVDVDSGNTILRYEVPVSDNGHAMKRYDQMVNALGCDENGCLIGDSVFVGNTLSNAIKQHRLPRRWS